MKSDRPVAPSMAQRLFLILLALLGTVLVLQSTGRYGAGLSPDSVEYIGTAQNIAAGVGIVTFYGGPSVLWPPLYPTLLAVWANTFGMGPLASARIVNALLFGLIVHLSGLLIIRHLAARRHFAILGAVAVLIARPLIDVAVMAWSEPLMILFVILFLIHAESYLAKPTMSSLLLLSSAAGLACLTRYIGVSLIASGIGVILLSHRRELKSTMVHLPLFILISTVPIGIWVTRNYALTGTLFGAREASVTTLSHNVSLTVSALLSWYVRGSVMKLRSLIILASATVGCFAAVRSRTFWPRAKAAVLQMTPSVLFIVIYVATLVIVSTMSAYDDIGDRLLSPVFVPATALLLTVAAELVSEPGGRFASRIVHVILVIGICAWLVESAGAGAMDAGRRVRDGAGGYSSRPWRESETIEYLRAHSLGAEYAMYSNAPDALYILTGRKGKRSPAKWDSVGIGGSWPEEGKAYLVWFDKTERDYLLTVEALGRISRVKQVMRFGDGAAYIVSKE